MGSSLSKVRPFSTIHRCHNCQKFNHKSNNCNSDTICTNCGEQDSHTNCEKPASCINCKQSNTFQDTHYDISHPASASQCPTYRYLLKKERDFQNQLFNLQSPNEHRIRKPYDTLDQYNADNLSYTSYNPAKDHLTHESSLCSTSPSVSPYVKDAPSSLDGKNEDSFNTSNPNFSSVMADSGFQSFSSNSASNLNLSNDNLKSSSTDNVGSSTPKDSIDLTPNESFPVIPSTTDLREQREPERCPNCQRFIQLFQYFHESGTCGMSPICSQCGDQEPHINCDRPARCSNCAHSNSSFDTAYSIDHPASSPHCPMYIYIQEGKDPNYPELSLS